MNVKPFAFVIMPFDESFDDTYNLGIKPACEAAGYYCERLDEQIFEETMLARIYNQIAKADLIIADMTGKNPNVFYETGFAHALEKRVILATKDEADIPFDLKHHYHIIYDNISSLKGELQERAAYYYENPLENTMNPFDGLQILINTIPLNLETGFEEATADDRIRIRIRTSRNIISINISIHTNNQAIDKHDNYDVRLLTSGVFPSAATQLNGESIRCETVAMAEGVYMHKSPSAVNITHYDPANITFEMRYNRIAVLPLGGEVVAGDSNEDNMVLRLVSKGLYKDIPIKAVVQGRHR
jgi:hypothetical protein